jgi:tRNA pseudouridine38-40 synthase
MARYQVILAYDGTDFHGSQRQNGLRTVQGVVEKALRQLGWSNSSVLMAGRTDAGVHATGQVVAFDLVWNHTCEDLQHALNASLPRDVAVRQVDRTSEDFHPRFDAQSRTYQYRIICDPVRDPLKERYAWRVWPPLDLERLIEASQILQGTHDFASFGRAPKKGGTTIRSVSRVIWWQDEACSSFEIVANAYLYHMVRRLVNIQVEIGQGKRDVKEMETYLKKPGNRMPQGLAPPQGLVLSAISYPPNTAQLRNF